MTKDEQGWSRMVNVVRDAPGRSMMVNAVRDAPAWSKEVNDPHGLKYFSGILKHAINMPQAWFKHACMQCASTVLQTVAASKS